MRAGAQDYVTKQNLARLVPVLDRELREARSADDRGMRRRWRCGRVRQGSIGWRMRCL